jgi:hypothetical protein
MQRPDNMVGNPDFSDTESINPSDKAESTDQRPPRTAGFSMFRTPNWGVMTPSPSPSVILFDDEPDSLMGPPKGPVTSGRRVCERCFLKKVCLRITYE